MTLKKFFCWAGSAFALTLFMFFWDVVDASSKERVERTHEVLIVFEEKEVARYNGVPEGIPSDVAVKMLRGEEEKYEGKIGTSSSVVSLIPPPAKLKERDAAMIYRHVDGKWTKEFVEGPAREETSSALSMLMLVPIALFFLVYATNRLHGRGFKRPAFFLASLVAWASLFPSWYWFDGSWPWHKVVTVIVVQLLLPTVALVYSLGLRGEFAMVMFALWCLVGGFLGMVPFAGITKAAAVQYEAVLVVGCLVSVAIFNVAERLKTAYSAMKEVEKVQRV